MDKKAFISFCKKEFEAHGFKKNNKKFYLSGHDLLCGIDLQKSNYSSSYYINYSFFLGKCNQAVDYPVSCASDIQGRIVVMSKTQTIKGKRFLTAMIEYEEYTEEELHLYFKKAFEEKILPPIFQGKKYILDNLGKLYTLTLHKETVMQKLLEGTGAVCVNPFEKQR